LPVRAVLLTNDVAVRLVVFVNHKSPMFKAYNVFEEPAADLKSNDGINIGYEKEIQVEYAPDLCGSKWIRCDTRGEFFDPPMPTLSFVMGDWGGLVFRWKNAAAGFDRLSSGD
jgi:hypothetical protein